MHEAVSDIRKQHENVLLLSAGGFFTGTIWYSIFKWEVFPSFMNQMNFTASVRDIQRPKFKKPSRLLKRHKFHSVKALGTEEFDHGTAGLLPFLKASNFPFLCANCNFSRQPEFVDWVKPYKLVEVEGHKVAIVGYLTPETMVVSCLGLLLMKWRNMDG